MRTLDDNERARLLTECMRELLAAMDEARDNADCSLFRSAYVRAHFLLAQLDNRSTQP